VIKGDSLERMCGFVVDNPQIIKGIYRTANYNDEPQLYQYSSQFVEGNTTKTSVDSIASGTSFVKDRALLKVLGETLERYSLGVYQKKEFVTASYDDLKKNSKNAVNPGKLYLFLYSSGEVEYFSNEDLVSTRLRWVRGVLSRTDRRIFVPAQLVYIPYKNLQSEPMLQMPISTGAAAGENISDALYRGICEIIERDSFMIHYYNRINSPAVDLRSLGSDEILQITKQISRYNLEVYVNDITTEIGIPAFVAIVVDRSGLGPAVSIGLKAGFEIEQDIVGAIEEALMVRSWIRDEHVYGLTKKTSINNKIIRSIEDRAAYWFPVDTIKYLDFWTKSKMLAKLQVSTKKSFSVSKKRVQIIIDQLEKRGHEVIHVEITAPIVAKYGFKVVKVFIPSLQALHLDEKYSYLNYPRLRNAPVTMGIYRKPKSMSEINKIPHPFL